MMRRWKMLGLATILSAAVSSAPAPAADSDTLKLTDSQKLDKLLEQFTTIKDALADLQGLKTEVKNLQTKIDGLQIKSDVQAQATQEKIDRLNERIKKLESDLDAMRNQIPPLTRISGFAPAAPSTGRIRIRNTFPEPVTVVVSGTPYELMPGDTRMLDAQPAGNFTYEVPGIQPSKTVTLAANETFTITVYPR
jgi:TolA-binding protein